MEPDFALGSNFSSSLIELLLKIKNALAPFFATSVAFEITPSIKSACGLLFLPSIYSLMSYNQGLAFSCKATEAVASNEISGLMEKGK